MSEPTLSEALGRIKREVAGTSVLIAALGGGSWFGLNQQDESEDKVVVQFYEQELGRCRMQVADQRKICLELVAAERENTAQWRAQCGGS